MTAQAEKFGVERARDSIKSVELTGEVKKLTGTKGEYLAKTVILATGAFPRPIGCKNEGKFVGTEAAETFGRESTVLVDLLELDANVFLHRA